MGHSSSAESPEIRLPQPPAGDRPYVMPVSRPAPPVTRHVVLFVLTFVTTTLVGAGYYLNFVTGIGTNANAPSLWWLLPNGLWFSVGVLTILGVHEFGHYYACRYYKVDASLPYFIPAPFGPGTLGAVIRIRQPIASKRQFFDIGIAGPIAGFVVLVPILAIGLSLSNVVTLPDDFTGYEYGEPLLFQLMERLFFEPLREHRALNLHPAGWAAWWGLLATALNLCPMGQLDGGHVSYAVFGRTSSKITVAVVALLVGLTVYSLVFLKTPSYLVWTLIVTVMLFVMGPHHPRVVDEDQPLDAARLWLAAFSAAILILSFTPVPLAFIGF